MTVETTPTRSVTEVRIVEAAAHLFSRQGFKAATTREIAHLADLNEVTIFRYFPRKPDLFRAALESRLSRVRLGRDLQMHLAADETPNIVFPMIVRLLVNSLSQQPELPRLLQVAAFELPGAENAIRKHLGPIFDAINAYIQRRAVISGTPKLTASIVTLGLLGSVAANRLLYQLIAGSAAPFTDPEEEAAAYAELWLRAME